VVLPRIDSFEEELGDAWGLSVDAGRTWKTVPVPGAIRINPFFNKVDVGGTRGRYSNIRIGSDDYPFVVVTSQKDGYRLVAIGADGSAKELLHTSTSAQIALVGTDHAGRRFLVRVGTATRWEPLALGRHAPEPQRSAGRRDAALRPDGRAGLGLGGQRGAAATRGARDPPDPDAAKQLFGLDGSVGALFIKPEGGASVNATGRTCIGGKGTYGYATPYVFAT